MCAAIRSADSGSDRSSAPPPKPSKWARPKRSGAHGLRRGAWYQVVNDNSPSLVILYVRKTNVPVPRSMLEFSDSPPTKWSVVKWEEAQRGARRASEANLGLTYAVCPACAERSPIDPPDAAQLTCDSCHGTFPVDWEHPC
ncbi:hypothetical protein HRbin33_00196 [bacterium HR33]|nr:hypothetical protein HRbin33_00196 [bacterium HR33]